MIKYSIVIPLKNEEENISPLLEELSHVMTPLNDPWEVICIDDGSTDKTNEILKELKITHPQLTTIHFDKNYGQSSAFDAGFKKSSGEYIITLDGDRQNDPSDIPKLLLMKEDFDLICGIRQKRKDTLFKKLISKLANRVRSKLCNDGVSDSGCSLKIYRKESLKKIKLYHGMHRFLPALFVLEGFRVGETPVSHRPRYRGKSHYNFFNRSIHPFLDLLAVYWMGSRQLKWKIK
ncbi:glycosyltransferase family 2 protein [Chlamydiales bacterium]|nr:glycosyltransferase family 2 protein [Chlamydiales bacterium]